VDERKSGISHKKVGDERWKSASNRDKLKGGGRAKRCRVGQEQADGEVITTRLTKKRTAERGLGQNKRRRIDHS